MAIIGKVNGVNLLDIGRSDTKLFLTIAKVDGLNTGTFLFATTTDRRTNFTIFRIVITSALNVFAVNNNAITDSAEFLINTVPPARPFSWDFSGHTGTTELYFTGLDLASITELSFETEGALQSLNTTGMTSLDSLIVVNNPDLTSLDLTTNTSLETLILGSFSAQSGVDDLTNVVGLENTVLTSIVAHGQGISNLGTLESLTNFTTVELPTNVITSINTSLWTSITRLILSSNNISTINLSTNTALSTLEISNNSLGALDLSNNPLIDRLSIGSNSITSLGLSANTVLRQFFSGGNSYTSLTFNSSVLATVFVSEPVTVLTGYNIAALRTFNIANCQVLTSVDLSNASGVQFVNLNSCLLLDTLILGNLNSLVNFTATACDELRNASFSFTTATICTSFNLNGSDFSSTQLDQFCIDINANTTVTGTINLSTQNTDTVTSSSLSARNSLIASGWTIIL